MYEMRPNFSFSRPMRFQVASLAGFRKEIKLSNAIFLPESFEGACDRSEPLDLLDLIPEQSTRLYSDRLLVQSLLLRKVKSYSFGFLISKVG